MGARGAGARRLGVELGEWDRSTQHLAMNGLCFDSVKKALIV